LAITNSHKTGRPSIDPGKVAGIAAHFIKCPICGVWIDMRDLGQVLAHEGRLPHPSEDQAQ
jgi:hypothetical protein